MQIWSHLLKKSLKNFLFCSDVKLLVIKLDKRGKMFFLAQFHKTGTIFTVIVLISGFLGLILEETFQMTSLISLEPPLCSFIKLPEFEILMEPAS